MRVTGVSLAASALPLGSWSSTRPAGAVLSARGVTDTLVKPARPSAARAAPSSWPTTSGTFSGAAPELTKIVTSEPLSAFTSAAGDWS